jgi:hypothetical protein
MNVALVNACPKTQLKVDVLRKFSPFTRMGVTVATSALDGCAETMLGSSA